MTDRRRWWTPLGVALLCGHCALAGLLALVGTAAGGAGLVAFGLDWNYVWPPVLMIGGFTAYLAAGRRAHEACATNANDVR